jgi:hypothetical protein
MERLFAFLHQYPVGMIQIRNLNIDPDYLWAKMRRELKTPPGAIMGIDGFLTELRKEFPELIVGNYSRFREEPSV